MNAHFRCLLILLFLLLPMRTQNELIERLRFWVEKDNFFRLSSDIPTKNLMTKQL